MEKRASEGGRKKDDVSHGGDSKPPAYVHSLLNVSIYDSVVK